MRTLAIYSVIKEYKPYDEVQLVRKIICVLGLSEDELYHEVPSMKEILLEEIFQSLKLNLKKYWMKKVKLMILLMTIFTSIKIIWNGWRLPYIIDVT